MPVTKIKGTDIETSSFETKVDTAVTSGAAANDVQPALPVGVILMYDGTGIADVATRTEDIGDRTGDTVTLAGWKVCNGNSTPNLLNKFIRSEIASGNTGGSDDAIVISHNHGGSVAGSGTLYTNYTQPNHQHIDPEPKNAGDNESFGHSSGLYGNEEYSANSLEGNERNALVSNAGGNHRHSINSHSHTISSDGVSGVGANKPAYYSLIFIKKVA